LGAIGDAVAIPSLRHYLSDPVKVVAETCELAIERIEYEMSHQGSKVEGDR